jgi:hypothetical protein
MSCRFVHRVEKRSTKTISSVRIVEQAYVELHNMCLPNRDERSAKRVSVHRDPAQGYGGLSLAVSSSSDLEYYGTTTGFGQVSSSSLLSWQLLAELYPIHVDNH